MVKPQNLRPPVHPGEVLREHFMRALGLALTGPAPFSRVSEAALAVPFPAKVA
jgi:plasmid maintenance system antidote protein VapI